MVGSSSTTNTMGVVTGSSWPILRRSPSRLLIPGSIGPDRLPRGPPVEPRSGQDSAMVTGVTQYAEIAMPDGTRLAATLFLPAECEGTQTDSGARVPCLLEALPYRKDD